jgi:rRNA maturation endonuclease Nob1
MYTCGNCYIKFEVDEKRECPKCGIKEIVPIKEKSK